MKKFFSILTVSLVFLACKKSSSDPNPVNPGAVNAKIKTQTTSSGMRTFSYDAQGRVTLITKSDGSKIEYTYSPGVMTRKYLDPGGVLQSTETEELNADGFSTRTTYSNNPNTEDLYFYNPDKTLAKMIIKNGANTTNFDYFWSNGNHDSTRLSNSSSVWQYTTITTFYTDKPNVLSDAAYGEQLWGKNSKNLSKSSFNRYPGGFETPESVNTYEFDEQGRVIKRTGTGNNNIYITLFTY